MSIMYYSIMNRVLNLYAFEVQIQIYNNSNTLSHICLLFMYVVAFWNKYYILKKIADSTFLHNFTII